MAMSMPRIYVSAFWASLAMASIANAHAADIHGDQVQPRHYPPAQCSTVTTTQREVCTVTVKEIVTIREYVTVTDKEDFTTTDKESFTVTDVVTDSVTQTERESFTTPISNLTYSATSWSTIPTTAKTTPSSNLTYSPTSRAAVSTTVNTTSSSVSTPTSCPVPPSCDNLGFNWAYYNNSAHNSDTTYSTFHPDTYKNVQPRYVNTTRYVGGLYGGEGATSPPGPIYDSSVDLKYDYFAINHHAYLYACQAGTYHISIPYANDAVYAWIGAKAYAGWADENADLKALYDQPDHIAGHANYTFSIPAATYVPIRFFYGQAQYGGGFTFNLTTPSGQVVVSNTEFSSPYVVQYSCDRVLAPQYPKFGSEL